MDKNKIIVFIEGYKFDVTKYAKIHPGGYNILKKYNGKDCTEIFNRISGHYDTNVCNLMDEMCIGKADIK
tara:strand:+ start:771 stop:980 length:210 start_codon:yes stop_codon:yes gene_type:complete